MRMLNVPKYLFLIVIGVFLVASAIGGERKIIKIEPIDSSLINNEVSMIYFLENKKIGSISYTKIPFLSLYIIHSFYIFPKFRNKGLGKELILEMIAYLKEKRAKKIYIQPGPFEITEDKAYPILHKLDRAIKIEKLKNLYSILGFQPANKVYSFIAKVFYKLMDINEDSDFLMVMYCY